ncbi:MAG: porin, partial [Methylophilaceae bacterium]
MNKKLGLAVAGAVLALSTTANAGITIPAGDWTVDIGGNVNAFYTNTRFSGDLKSSEFVTDKTHNVIQT